MDLWIRSQDRHTLQKVTKLYVEKFDIEGYYAIYDFPEECDEVDIGHYSSKERALEVLEEIQNLILGILTKEEIEEQKTKKYTGLGTLSMKSNNIVYEMPKE